MFFLLFVLSVNFGISYDVCFGTKMKCVRLPKLPDFNSMYLPLQRHDSIGES